MSLKNILYFKIKFHEQNIRIVLFHLIIFGCVKYMTNMADEKKKYLNSFHFSKKLIICTLEGMIYS